MTGATNKPGGNKSDARLQRMGRARRRASAVVADYVQHVLSIKGWSQAELARQLEVPVSRINFLLHGKPRAGYYGHGYQSIAVPFLFEIEEISGVRLKIAAAPTGRAGGQLKLVHP